ncbi:hypothetical protein BJY04DRAFT_233215 [Aspergillus karnatakaensis]|uniref:alkene reductase n=1 Tax=Aspergillus karnatakaensis TaxID=1810916 RepID=UPI003CCDFC33
MSDTKLFQPLKLGQLQLRHRIAMAPMTRFRADTAHTPLPYMTEYYAQRSHTPGTLLITENTGVSETHVGYPNNTGIYTQAHIDAWRKVTDAVHAKGCYIFLQLNGAGRTADKGFPQLAPSAVPLRQEDSAIPIQDAGPPKAMSEEEIQECIRDFAQAAKNAIVAGFDGVEIHSGNGYLVDEFLQESMNHRSDRWGGSVANRSRFGFEVARAVVEAVGVDRVGFRISPFSTYMGVKPVQPVEQFLDLVRRLKGLDLAYLHIIEACVDNWYDVDRHDSIEFLLKEWDGKTPVVVAGGYDAVSAREAVDTKYAAFDTVVAVGRGFLSTPDLVARFKRGAKVNAYDSETFYAPELRRGYIDYPTADVDA